MNLRIQGILVLLLVSEVFAYAQGIRNVGGEYLYYADPDMSPKAAKAAAIENARIQSIAAEFGTLILHQTDQQDNLQNENESSFFMQLSTAEVKGEWIEDSKDAECEFVEMLPDGMCVYRARVYGKARAISNESPEFLSNCLKNGTTEKYADTSFRDGDDLFVSFRSPVDGYLAIYLVDQSNQAFCLLPYSDDLDGQYRVRRNKDYVFFSEAHADAEDVTYVDELVMKCDGEYEERNQLYVIFSPNAFTKAVDGQITEDLPRQLSYPVFQTWLSRCRRRDTKMGVKVFLLKIME